MKKYQTPEMELTLVSCEDVLLQSDTFIDVEGLWDENTGV